MAALAPKYHWPDKIQTCYRALLCVACSRKKGTTQKKDLHKFLKEQKGRLDYHFLSISEYVKMKNQSLAFLACVVSVFFLVKKTMEEEQLVRNTGFCCSG